MTADQIAALEADSKDTQLYIPATTLVRVLEERKILLDLVRRLRQWDHLNGAGDGPFWTGELDHGIVYVEGEAP